MIDIEMKKLFVYVPAGRGAGKNWEEISKEDEKIFFVVDERKIYNRGIAYGVSDDDMIKLAEGEELLKLEGNVLSTNLKIEMVQKESDGKTQTFIQLKNGSDESAKVISEINASKFVIDGVVKDAEFIKVAEEGVEDVEAPYIKLTMNTAEGEKAIRFSVKDLVDIYKSGNDELLTIEDYKITPIVSEGATTGVTEDGAMVMEFTPGLLTNEAVEVIQSYIDAKDDEIKTAFKEYDPWVYYSSISVDFSEYEGEAIQDTADETGTAAELNLGLPADTTVVAQQIANKTLEDPEYVYVKGNNAYVTTNAKETYISDTTIENSPNVYNVFEQSQNAQACGEFQAAYVEVKDPIAHNVFNIYNFEDGANVTISNCKFNLNVANSNVMRAANYKNAENVTINFENIEWTYENAGYTDADKAWAGLMLFQPASTDVSLKGDVSKLKTWTINIKGCKYHGVEVTENNLGEINQCVYCYNLNGDGVITDPSEVFGAINFE